MSRPIAVIAADVRKHWRKKDGSPNVNYAAEPYLAAMRELNSIEDDYYLDTAQSVVMYFLANATAFRGEDARRIKAELKALLLTPAD